jgi:hypothetical protein
MQNRVNLIRRPLRNLTCPYCFVSLEDVKSTKEHVIGRGFVPKGSLNRSLNVILRACHPCNVHKSDLEDEISTLSMYPDLARGYDGMGSEVQADSVRKLAKSVSRSTRKLIADSSEEHTINSMPLPSLKMSISMTTPPQMNEARVFELAHYQIRGFFYALTYNPETRLGGVWPEGGFFPITFSRRTDWGNPIHRWFMGRVADWPERIIGHFADNHFHIAIRRAPTAELWSFALEWNRSTRIIGFFGRKDSATAIAQEIPEMPMIVIGQSADGGVFRMREDTPLPDGDDRLFYSAELKLQQPRSVSAT